MSEVHDVIDKHHMAVKDNKKTRRCKGFLIKRIGLGNNGCKVRCVCH